jgi:uncharacterized membrane protein YqjE
MALNARTPQPAQPGLLASLRKLGSTLAAILHTRLELLTREFERERIRVMRLVLIGVVGLFFFFLGTVTLTLFIIVLFWDSQRLVVIGCLAVLYLGLAAGLAMYAKGEAGRSARPFASTLAEFKKDREQLRL